MTEYEMFEIGEKLGLNCGGKGSKKPGRCPGSAKTGIKGYGVQRRVSRLKKHLQHKTGAPDFAGPKGPTPSQAKFLKLLHKGSRPDLTSLRDVK